MAKTRHLFEVTTDTLEDFVSIDPAKRVCVEGDAYYEPGDETPYFSFSVSEAAKVFFARSAHWLRWCEREGHLTDRRTKTPVVARRTKANTRIYLLPDIEAMARTLYANGRINRDQLVRVLMLVLVHMQVCDLKMPEVEEEVIEDE